MALCFLIDADKKKQKANSKLNNRDANSHKFKRERLRNKRKHEEYDESATEK